jgi:AraC-like DNA-binding protein
MKRFVFSSERLSPQPLDDTKKFMLWRDHYAANFGARDFSRPADRRFRAKFEFAQFGPVGLGAFEGTINHTGRTPHDVQIDPRDAYFFLINTGSQLTVRQHGRETTIAPGHATLLSFSETADFRGHSENSWFSATVPQDSLRELVHNVDDLLACPLDQDNEALKHLQQYVKILLGPSGVGDSSFLTDHVGKNLLHLMAFSLSSGRDTAGISGMRTIRAARAREIVTEIRSGFSDPSFSSARVAAKVRLSERYIQDLLAETGKSFTERVMEERLQKARRTLESSSNDRMTIADIASECGFNEISYFNRSFRRRFGASPGDVRKRRK